MAGLQHWNLVRLLAYCNQSKERILVYEYMEKSLDNYPLFGETSIPDSLNWARIVEIIHGIAHGVVYLHGGSGKSVIHGDLKLSNILLDSEWKPKIAGFGTTKLFAVDQMGHDQIVLASPGYAAPEYGRTRKMTLECDVYSFGIIILETLSGRGYDDTDSLLSHVSELCQRNSVMELLNEMGLPRPESDSDLLSKLERCIETALHCVRDIPSDRPPMSDIVSMLTSRTSRGNLTRHETGGSMFTSNSS